jgi:hypothetical protein
VFGGSEYNPYLRSASESGAPSIRRAGGDPFRRAYDEQLGNQASLAAQIGRSKAEAQAAKYGAKPTSPQSKPSFSDGLIKGFADNAGQLASGVIGSLFGGGSSPSNNFSSAFSSTGPSFNPIAFSSGLNLLPAATSGITSNFSSAFSSGGPSFSPSAWNFLK